MVQEQNEIIGRRLQDVRESAHMDFYGMAKLLRVSVGHYRKIVKQHRLREPDKSKYEIYKTVKDEIGKSRNWRQLQTKLAEKGIGIHFKYRGQTGEVQGISFSKGEYTFKGSEIDRSFSFSKLDKCFGDAGLNTAGNNRQTVSAPVQELSQTLGKADSPLLTGLGGLFSAPSSPADETPDNPGERKKKKKKRHLKL